MYYENTEEVIEKLKLALQNECGETLSEVDAGKDPRSIAQRSIVFRDLEHSRYLFRVYLDFIQARVPEDFSQPIEVRLKDVLSGFDLAERGSYVLTTRIDRTASRSEVPIVYCILNERMLRVKAVAGSLAWWMLLTSLTSLSVLVPDAE